MQRNFNQISVLNKIFLPNLLHFMIIIKNKINKKISKNGLSLPPPLKKNVLSQYKSSVFVVFLLGRF